VYPEKDVSLSQATVAGKQDRLDAAEVLPAIDASSDNASALAEAGNGR
jgi:hypothetical protein